MEQFGDPRANPKQLPVKPLGEVCMVERGGSPRPIADYVTDSEDGINWIKIGDADGTRYISETAEKIIPEGVKVANGAGGRSDPVKFNEFWPSVYTKDRRMHSRRMARSSF